MGGASSPRPLPLRRSVNPKARHLHHGDEAVQLHELLQAHAALVAGVVQPAGGTAGRGSGGGRARHRGGGEGDCASLARPSACSESTHVAAAGAPHRFRGSYSLRNSSTPAAFAVLCKGRRLGARGASGGNFRFWAMPPPPAGGVGCSVAGHHRWTNAPLGFRSRWLPELGVLRQACRPMLKGRYSTAFAHGEAQGAEGVRGGGGEWGHLMRCATICSEKCRLPSASARCSSHTSSCPLPSRSIALNHCSGRRRTADFSGSWHVRYAIPCSSQSLQS